MAEFRFTFRVLMHDQRSLLKDRCSMETRSKRILRRSRLVAALCLASIFLAACATTESQLSRNAARNNQFHHFTLLSWKLPSGLWCFSLREGDRFDEGVKSETQSRICGLKALKIALAKLPRGSHVNWNKYRA